MLPLLMYRRSGAKVASVECGCGVLTVDRSDFFINNQESRRQQVRIRASSKKKDKIRIRDVRDEEPLLEVWLGLKVGSSHKSRNVR